MKVLLLILLLFMTLPNAAQTQKETFEHKLRESTSKGVMFGHHDDTMYGYNWRYTGDGRSDTKDVTGQYPAVMSFDLSDIDKGFKNRSQYDQMREEIRRQHARGGYNTISWHATNPVTGKNAWDNSHDNVVHDILSGGKHHAAFLSALNHVAEFFLSLTDEKGNLIPIIFRPWHECNGDWFWWGSKFCTTQEYKALWKLTVKVLKRRGVSNVIYAYSPGANIRSEEDFIKRYPGDGIVSILGVEGYAIRTTATESQRNEFIRRLRRSFDVVAPIAQHRHKILALTETGTKFNNDTEWWTRVLLPSIEGYPICFLVVWRNATQDDNECFSVYKGHPSENDFKKFANNPHILFVK